MYAFALHIYTPSILYFVWRDAFNGKSSNSSVCLFSCLSHAIYTAMLIFIETKYCEPPCRRGWNILFAKGLQNLLKITLLSKAMWFTSLFDKEKIRFHAPLWRSSLYSCATVILDRRCPSLFRSIYMFLNELKASMAMDSCQFWASCRHVGCQVSFC